MKDIEQKIRSEIEVRRKITATQGSARQTVLLLNLIIFSAVLIMAPQAAAYRTGAGQLVFLVLFGVLIGVMMIIRRTVALRPIPRIWGMRRLLRRRLRVLFSSVVQLPPWREVATDDGVNSFLWCCCRFGFDLVGSPFLRIR